MVRTCLTFLFIFLISFVAPASGQVLRIEVTDYGFLEIIPPSKDLLDDYLRGVENDLNRDQPIRDPQRLMEGVANATAISGKGLGVDYITEFDTFMIGAGLGAGADLEKNAAIRDEISGVGVSPSLMFGFKGKTEETEKFSGFIHLGIIEYDRTFPGQDFDIAANLKGTSFGFHLRYDWIEAEKEGSLRWGGVRIVTGYEFIQNELTLQTTVDQNLELSDGNGFSLTGRLTGKPEYQIDTTIHSIPIEIVSDVRLYDLFTFYGGAGMDINSGKSKGRGTVNGDVSPLLCSGPFCVSGAPLPQARVVADLDANEKVDPLTFRGFLGMDVKIKRAHFFAQVNKTMGDKVTGLAAGIRAEF